MTRLYVIHISMQNDRCVLISITVDKINLPVPVKYVKGKQVYVKRNVENERFSTMRQASCISIFDHKVLNCIHWLRTLT